MDYSRAMMFKLVICLQRKKVIKDAVILREGEPSQLLYFIKQGEFELSKKIKKAK
jgi:CRP-like cAMP-binding protein